MVYKPVIVVAEAKKLLYMTNTGRYRPIHNRLHFVGVYLQLTTANNVAQVLHLRKSKHTLTTFSKQLMLT